MNVNLFAGFSNNLDSLTNEMKENVKELIFACRNDSLSTIVVFNSKSFVEELANIIFPDETLTVRPNRYYIDLESINTDKIRIYTDSPHEAETSIYGYYLNENGKIYEKKIYKRFKDSRDVLKIYRYDNFGNQIGDVEEEVMGDSSIWKGPNDIINVANENRYKMIFMRKIAKDRCYLRLLKF